jgi:hypothetical protein
LLVSLARISAFANAVTHAGSHRDRTDAGHDLAPLRKTSVNGWENILG